MFYFYDDVYKKKFYYNFDNPPIINLDNWDVSNIIDIESLFTILKFNKNINIKLLYNRKIAQNTSNIINMNNMFKNAKSFKGNILNWNIDTLLTMNGK
jgi:hypothetical protein